MILRRGLMLLVTAATAVAAFAPTNTSPARSASIVLLQLSHNNDQISGGNDDNLPGNKRRSLISSVFLGGIALATTGSDDSAFAADEDEESFASIAARASKLSTEVGDKTPTTISTITKSDDTRTAYDFTLPVEGSDVPFKEIVRQQYDEEGRARVKALLVVNMKEDDPVARKDIPEFISLASKYGRSGEFAVIMSPSDQGYYEPDTSQLIRLKLASEYGYGINPATVVTDKVIFLGTGAHPFWRWLQKNCRTPAGLGRIEGNFEKFLVDGRTGTPLRRYPRKYKPLDIKNDIEAIMAGKPLPPAGANYNEQWRNAAVESERDTYRFQKGLNYFDQ